MSVEILREAAAKMAKEACAVRRPLGRDERVALAVADWLNAAADHCPTTHNSTPEAWNSALAVARAYLGGAR